MLFRHDLVLQSSSHDETAPMAPSDDDPMDPGPQVFDFRKGLISFFSQTPRGKRPSIVPSIVQKPSVMETSLNISLGKLKNKSLS